MRNLCIIAFTVIFAAAPSVMHADTALEHDGFFRSFARALASPFLGFSRQSKAAAPPQEADAEVSIMMHLCPPAISASEDFDALGDLEDKLAACPAAIFGAAASADSSAPFLMRMRGSEQAAIGGPKLVGASYVFEDVPGGEASIIPAFEPAGSRFGALEFERGGEALVSYGGGIVNLDTRLAGADGISVHVFNFTGGEVQAY